MHNEQIDNKVNGWFEAFTAEARTFTSDSLLQLDVKIVW